MVLEFSFVTFSLIFYSFVMPTLVRFTFSVFQASLQFSATPVPSAFIIILPLGRSCVFFPFLDSLCYLFFVYSPVIIMYHPLESSLEFAFSLLLIWCVQLTASVCMTHLNLQILRFTM